MDPVQRDRDGPVHRIHVAQCSGRDLRPDALVQAEHHPRHGQLHVRWCELNGDLDQYGASSYTQKDFGLITFTTPGNHKVRLTLTGKNASSTGFTSSAD